MHRDIVLPKNNEQEFIELAQKLDFKKLYFLYDFGQYTKEKSQKNFSQNKNLDIEIGFLVNEKNINKALQHSNLLAVKSSGNDRFFIESKKIKLIYGFEEIYKKDFLHQRASGLNHTICELSRKNNIVIGFAYGSLVDKNENTALLIGRAMQNIKLCQKYKVKTFIGSFSENPFDLRAAHDIQSLYTMLGMSGKNIKDSLTLNL